MRSSQHSLPDFFLLGAAKCGTTSLHDYLRQHPELFLPYAKELNVFDADAEQFATEIDRYHTYFSEAGDRLAGEATPSYFRRVDVVPARMRRLYGDTSPRFLLLLRDPVQRAYSHYLHNVSEGREPLTFAAALQAEQAHPASKWRAWKGYFADGVYADTLNQWFETFPRERFLILLSHNLASDPEGVLQRIFHFLDVDSDVSIDTGKRLNQTGERQSRVLGQLLAYAPDGALEWIRQWMPKSIRLGVEQFIRRRSTGNASDRPTLDLGLERNLRQRYDPHVQRLATLIDRDLSAWRSSAPSAHPTASSSTET